MQHQWPAAYLDGQTAIRHPATVRVMGSGLEVTTSGGWTRLWPYREIRRTQGLYEGEEVRLERGGDEAEVILIADRRFLESLQEVAPQLGPRFHDPSRPQRWVRVTVLAAVAVVGLTGALYLWGIPVLAAALAPRIPVAWEAQLGRSMLPHLAPADQVCSDARRQVAIDAITARLIATVPRSPYTFRVIVVNRPDVNAMAAPGGQIVLFRGLVEHTRTPEELAGVLAHEIQHVLLHHSTRALIQHASTGLLIAALTGDMTGPLAYGLQSARVLGQLQYSRRAEAEADSEGMKMLLAARIDPRGMTDFLSGLLTTERAPRTVLKYLSTHPATSDRVEQLRRMAAGARNPPLPLLPDSDWRDLQAICSAGGR
jgi:predicted Zn-dependent protease